MSKLLDALESLMLFFQNHFPDEANSFLPGLSRDQIIDMFSQRSLPCPREILDLYAWRNGTPSGFSTFYGLPPEFYFMPLEEVMQIYDEYYLDTGDLECLDTIESDYGQENIRNALSPVGINENYRVIHFVDAQEGQFYSVVLGAERSFIILYMDEGGQQDLCFESLTSMMQTIAASYQEGAYVIKENGELELEPELFKEIWARYNPLISQVSSSARVIDRYIAGQIAYQLGEFNVT